MKHDDAFANKGAEKYPGYAFRAFEPQLEKPFTECFGVRLSKVGAKDHHPAREHDITCGKRVRQLQDLLLYGLAVVNDAVFNSDIITIMLIRRKRCCWA